MRRYHLIEVGCLECSFDGDSEPTLIMSADETNKLLLMMTETKYSHSVDRFVFDSMTGRIVTLEREVNQ